MGKWQKVRMPQNKMFHIFVPNLEKICQFAHKIAFSVNLRLIQGHGATKSDFRVRNVIYLVHLWY